MHLLLGFSIRVAVLWPGQRGPIRSRVIVTGLLPGSLVASAVTLSTTVKRIGDSRTRRKYPIFEIAVCNVYRPVHVGLILTEPAVIVQASERRLSWSRAVLTAGVTRFRRVTGIYCLDGNPSPNGFVANLCVEFGKA